jgi:hypothetical protein
MSTNLPVEFADPAAPRCAHCGLELHPGATHEPQEAGICLVTEPDPDNESGWIIGPVSGND